MKKIQYSYPQVKRILKEEGLYLETLYRYKERVRHYHVRRIGTEEIVLENVTLNYIRYRLTWQGYSIDYLAASTKKGEKKIIVDE